MWCPKKPGPAHILISRWKFEHRKYTNLRSPTFLIFLNKPVLKADLGVAVAELIWAAGGSVECRGNADVKLSIWDQAVIKFKGGSDARGIPAYVRSSGECVKFPMFVINRLRIISAKWRSRNRRNWKRYDCETPTRDHGRMQRDLHVMQNTLTGPFHCTINCGKTSAPEIRADDNR